jgi:hypothetical protein
MSKTSVALVAAALALAPLFAFADDQTQWITTPAEQAKMKEEAVTKNSAFAKMTPEERAAARNASDAEHQKYLNTILELTQNPGESRNMGINQSAAASKAGPTPPRGTINTPEAWELLLKQRGS